VTGAVPARSQESLRLGGVSFWGDFTATGAIATAFQIAVLAALGCGEFCRGSPPKPVTEGQAGRRRNAAPGFRVCGFLHQRAVINCHQPHSFSRA
jgi:hypothetical protein